jgi:hypothetical protein
LIEKSGAQLALRVFLTRAEDFRDAHT